MQAPDFAQVSAQALTPRDLVFLFEHFPVPGIDAVEAAQRVIERPSTLDSMLEADYVFDAIHDRQTLWLEVSPQLFFNVMLRHCLPSGPRESGERQAIHYLANLLGLFTHAERLYRVTRNDADAYQYLVDLVAAASQAGPERGFLVHSHIGNFAMFTAGIRAEWVEHRHRYKRRPVTVEYYCKMGCSYYFRASRHPLASEFGVQQVFRELAERFGYYRDGLANMARTYLGHSQSPAISGV
ncbi:hypothetical protein [Solimonas marina]|uniref:Uncharacterized protein n=1 Tax=Solimonas marina TaxID=2714601 RepID=A0A969W801_9GAMM|nr:hypothetical protein [Solimonas marina]NKF22307.1 hypothetical protein [Solimonas marina]